MGRRRVLLSIVSRFILLTFTPHKSDHFSMYNGVHSTAGYRSESSYGDAAGCRSENNCVCFKKEATLARHTPNPILHTQQHLDRTAEEHIDKCFAKATNVNYRGKAQSRHLSSQNNP